MVISFTEAKSDLLDKNTSIENIHDRPIENLTVKNDGQLFKEQDWNRLKEIAKGNPDETKIGAFGVGFYSVFELTDEPLVHSGDTVMSFYYIGDQLHFRRTKTKSDMVSSSWTVVDLPYRSPGKLPSLAPFTAFLTQSFMLVPLMSITLELDGLVLLNLSKTCSPPVDVPIPSSFDRRSANKSLQLKAVNSSTFQVGVKYMNVTQMDPPTSKTNILNFGRKLFASFITTSKDPNEITEVVCFLRKVSAVVTAKVSSTFASKIKQTVMKAPPSEAVISMLTYSKDEKDLSELQPPLSHYIMPKEFNDAKIFIGFPTKQSTSLRSHIAMNQLIPTMERTAIDMSNAFVKEWNEQLLYMSGVLCRVVYENEMLNLSQFKGEEQIKRACHVMSRFEFDRSTPDASVGAWISAGFWSSNSLLSLPTTNGIKFSSEARVTDQALFLKLVNLVPEIYFKESPKFIKNAIDIGMLKYVDHNDILDEVQGRPISLKEMKMLILWCGNNARSQKLSRSMLRAVINATVVSNHEMTLPLGPVTTYQNHLILPSSLPLPPSCIPFEYIKSISASDIDILEWKELSVIEWLDYVITNANSLPESQNVNISTEFSVVVLKKISDYWYNFNTQEKEIVFKLLRPITCIPTQFGMKQPSESYLKEIALFPYLPVKIPQLTASYEFLFKLGLRESVDMAFVLENLHNPEKSSFKWTTVDVVKYLTENRKSLKSTDWELLRNGSFFEGYDAKLYQASKLYSPNKDLAAMGFLTLKWESWSNDTAEASLLFDLGLKRAPTPADLFKTEKKSVALRYYISHYNENAYLYNSVQDLNVKIVPCTIHETKVLSIPKECYLDPELAIFGLPVVEPYLRKEAWKLGVKEATPMDKLIQILVHDPPKTILLAEKQFIYLASRTSEIRGKHKKMCSEARIIPIENPSGIKYFMPSKIFIGDETSNEEDEFFNDFFDFAKFSPAAFPFLLRIGVRQRPDLSEIIHAAVNDPVSMYQLASTPTRYQRLLMRIALEWNSISRDISLVQQMKSSKFLIGQYVGNDDEDGQEVFKSTLDTASKIMILDDIIAFNTFKDEIRVAPQSIELEGLYAKLGSQKLSSAIETVQDIGQRLEMTDLADKIQQRIRERSMLFLEGKKGERRVKPTEMTKLQVVSVKKIQLRRRINIKGLVGSFKTESITACLDSRNSSIIYCVLDKLDWFDVSQCLVKEILKKPNPDSVIVLELQLNSDLKSLQKKGYNVDRLLQQRRQNEVAAEEREKVKLTAQERLLQLKDKAETVNQTTSKTAPLPTNKTISNEVMKMDTKSQFSPSEKTLQSSNEASTSTGPKIPPLFPSGGNTIKQHQNQNFQSQSASSSFMKLFKRPQTSQSGLASGIASQVGRQTTRSLTSSQNNNGHNLASDTLLQNGIKKSGAFNSNKLDSRINDIDVSETGVMPCDESVAKDLVKVTDLPGGPRCFVKSGEEPLSGAYIQEAERFKTILLACSQVSYSIS